MPAILRVKESVAVRDPESDVFVALRAGEIIDPASPLVVAYPWAFQRDATVETATARPGDKRTVTR
jgi:hypothetical protein